jgi:[acyl-carrier-protein] S-malonyltransferase
VIIGAFPGQGSQSPGFLYPWLDLPGARDLVGSYGDAAGVDLIAAGTQWDADAIRDTQVAQPLIVAASLLSWWALGQRTNQTFDGVAGHSVGEIAALVAANVLSADDGMRLVGIRGRAMADAAARESTGMAAVVGGVEADVLARLSELDLTPANYNGGGQIVAAGATDRLAELAASGPRGARVIPLQVAGAFHTRYMVPAVETLASAASELAPADPSLRLWTNADGTVVTSGVRALELLVGQVASPVRWDLCMASFAESGVTGIVEFAPAGTLVGLAKRVLRGVPSVAVKTPDDLDAAVALLSEENA